MGMYRKKPVVIEAWQLTVEALCDSGIERPDWIKAEWCNDDGTLSIPTLEGTMIADIDDWVIRGVKGEVYPCKPDIFAATYEPAQRRTTASTAYGVKEWQRQLIDDAIHRADAFYGQPTPDLADESLDYLVSIAEFIAKVGKDEQCRRQWLTDEIVTASKELASRDELLVLLALLEGHMKRRQQRVKTENDAIMAVIAKAEALGVDDNEPMLEGIKRKSLN